MPESSDDIFEFDPASFWEQVPHFERRTLVPVTNQNTGDVVYISAEKLKAKSEQEIIAEVEKYHYRYNLFKSNLNLYPEQIQKFAQLLRENSRLLSWVAKQLAFHLIELYEHLVKIRLKKTGSFFDSELPPVIVSLDKEGDLASVKLNLNETDIKEIVKHLEEDLAPGLEIAKIWEQSAEAILTYRSVSAMERMEHDLGDEAFDNLSSESREEILYQYLEGEKSVDLESEILLILQDISQQIVPAIIKGLDFPNLTLANLDRILGFKQDNKVLAEVKEKENFLFPQPLTFNFFPFPHPGLSDLGKRSNANEPIPVTESRLTNAIIPIPTFAALNSAIVAQIRKDLWGKDNDGIAYLKHQAKGNPNNYIEHYISSPGDIEVLPWEQAEQIIDKFGFNTVKLHLIFAAHTMNPAIHR